MIFSPFGFNFQCFHANVNSKTFKGLHTIKSPFWSTVLFTWLDNNRMIDNNKCNPMLWNNKQFSYRGDILFFSDWASKGLISIDDIIVQNEILTYQRICELIGHNANRLLEYNMVSAVARRLINNNIIPMLDRKNNINVTPLFCDKKVLKARQYRNILASNLEIQACSINFYY